MTDTPHTSIATDASSPRRVSTAIGHRWPTWFGLAFAALNLADFQDGRALGLIVYLAALIYLATAVIGRPTTVWTLFWLSVVAVALLRVFDVDPWPPLVAGAASVTVVGLVGGLLRQPRLTAAQLPAMLVFGTAVLLALSLPPQLGGYLVAAALIGHAVQDVVVWRAGKVVARSMAEFCAVLDFTLGAAIIVLSLAS
ncbi:hypothetical protein SAMN05421874_10770 [Nonomuraea maritima]|uniref:Uncharacterized protein n=1 Tax=Nonomuraea maritima TaxID=683260 RepID=A0A1G9BAD8_9ACTN|nr:hypothetical protein [Nonomuraea maritima]SDK36034.1 hypothetical protein SAMN05421874_10770 [Nonomuraea maritima]